MNIASISLNFESVISNSHFTNLCAGEKANGVLRMVLLDNEHLRISNKNGWQIRVHSGKAWVSWDGVDHYLQSGECQNVPISKYGAIISPMGKEALFFELIRENSTSEED